MSHAAPPIDLDGLRRLDPLVISAVYEYYFPDVYRYVRYRLNDERAAEDIASEVFVRLLETIRANRAPESHLKAWLLATAAHMTADHFRKSYRRPTNDLPEDLPDRNDDPPARYEARERTRQLHTALADLTEEQQHVITLRFNLGLSLEETAQQMKKNVNAIKQLQFRALAALNRKLGGAP
jgi:RNA polymerase sigma-70 factor (ECF subfamily)